MDLGQGAMLFLYGIVLLFAVGTILSGFFQVQTAEAAVIQRMGKFQRVATAGMNFKLLGSIKSLGASIYACSSLLLMWRPKLKTTSS
jgi:regulator of protease activity HflC (stomatin/prohibitin superfamily)